MGWWKKLQDMMAASIPIDYQKGYIDGFLAGTRFYKDSIDKMHNAVLHSDKIKESLHKTAQELNELRTQREQHDNDRASR